MNQKYNFSLSKNALFGIGAVILLALAIMVAVWPSKPTQSYREGAGTTREGTGIYREGIGGAAPVAHNYQPEQYAHPAPVQAQPAPVVVQQAASSRGTDMLTGAAIGALATHALTSKPAAPAPERIVERRTVVKYVQTPRPSVRPQKPYVPAYKSDRYVSTYKAPTSYRPASYSSGSSYRSTASFSKR